MNKGQAETLKQIGKELTKAKNIMLEKYNIKNEAEMEVSDMTKEDYMVYEKLCRSIDNVRFCLSSRYN